MTNPIDNSEDVIDSRDVIERIEDLETDAQIALEEWAEERGVVLGESYRAIPTDDDEAAELDALRKLAEEGETVADWEYGATLIRDSYFTEYAQELAEGIGALPQEHSWPQSYIDWESAARDLRMDYTSLDFSGVTYWTHS